MKTLITSMFLVFFTSSAFAAPLTCHGNIDSFNLVPPFRFSQVVNGFRKMVERDCGYCKFYDFKSTPPKESVNQAFISINETNIDEYDYFVSIIISCPALTGIDGILELEFSVGPIMGELSYHRAYKLPSRSLFIDKDSENMIVNSLFDKLYKFYGWTNRDAKYGYFSYIIDFSNLNDFSGRFKEPVYTADHERHFENVSYSYLIFSIRLFQNVRNDSCIFYTNTNSPGYIADKDSRAAQDHLIKLATDDGQTILRFNFASPGWPKAPISLVFKPDPKRKILKLSKVLVGKKKIDPNAAELRKFWEYLATCVELSNSAG